MNYHKSSIINYFIHILLVCQTLNGNDVITFRNGAIMISIKNELYLYNVTFSVNKPFIEINIVCFIKWNAPIKVSCPF